ncbi:oxidoreductase [Alpinimonas psychrophila]|uniref:NAD(P)-dependent dehydrogenase (Short-subunit alcohol dehydrogenase family) n=1 Tax=Alpinimonas psychrophila TaxID=748908 RepID=A0A7W3PPY5_9MICO|nr:SDR family NAD(P)-dependent oxidoreductase [Alpinimonas psychrophila]MBA8829920.1 NAD(P)-dependent dehydrogenase (short-subunit alcohol dehydrogenase family) [Alpinimonas psychrophila]
MPKPLLDLPRLDGKRAIITGANSGLGFETALVLSALGAEVTLAVRNTVAGAAAVDRIRTHQPDARLAVEPLDLADLASVRAFTAAQTDTPLDILINNAGIMAPPFSLSVDGIESQMATNHVGHFALTAGLLPALLRGSGGRVVSLSSVAHRRGSFTTASVDEVRGTDIGYSAWNRYGTTKLACLMFALELDRRAKAANIPIVSVAAHPGWASTNLQKGGNERANFLAQSAATGARSQILASTSLGLSGGEFIGPRLEIWGKPRIFTGMPRAYDESLADALWASTEELMGTTFAL